MSKPRAETCLRAGTILVAAGYASRALLHTVGIDIR